MDKAVTNPFRGWLVMKVRDYRMISHIGCDWLGVKCHEHGIFCFEAIGTTESVPSKPGLKHCRAVRGFEFGPDREKRIILTY